MSPRGEPATHPTSDISIPTGSGSSGNDSDQQQQQPTTTTNIITKEEVLQKRFVIFENAAYDIQSYLPSHPGGSNILKGVLGDDITNDFYNTGHSQKATDLLKSFYVADVMVSDDEEGGGGAARQRRKLWRRSLEWESSRRINDDSNCWELEFSWIEEEESGNDDDDDEPCRLPPGGHIKLTVEMMKPTTDQEGSSTLDNSANNTSTRSYTPVSFDITSRRLILAVKLYDNGEMSRLLRQRLEMENDDNDNELLFSFEMMGPFGEISYGTTTTTAEETTAKAEEGSIITAGGMSYSSKDRLILIAGGTGITPFLSVLRQVASHKAPLLSSGGVVLIYCASSKEEVMYDEELKRLLSRNGDALHIIAPCKRDTLEEQIRTLLAPYSPTDETCGIICGPPGMEDAVQRILTEKLHYSHLLTSTTLAAISNLSNSTTSTIQKPPPSSSSWLTQNGKFHGVMFTIALILPLAAIAINGFIIPSSWPHTAAFPPNPVGFGGKFPIAGFNETNADGDKVTRYAYRLSAPTALAYASPWIGYAIHQIATLVVLYEAFRRKPKYSTTFRDFNWQMLAVQTGGVLLKYVQQIFFYNGLSEVLPLGFGTGTVFLYLIVVMLMYIPVRGLFFGYGKWNFTKDCAQFFRTYHGFFIATFIVNDFWYHPFESTLGHLFGILNDAMLLGQMVIIYMPFHLNKYWCLAMETFVIFHAALIALNRGTSGAVGAFGFAYFFIFVLTQMHGVGWSLMVRWFIGLVFASSILVVYGMKLQGEEYGFKAMVMEVFLRIPILEYFTIFFILGYFILSKKIVACLKTQRGKYVAIGGLILLGTAICFMPLIAIFL